MFALWEIYYCLKHKYIFKAKKKQSFKAVFWGIGVNKVVGGTVSIFLTIAIFKKLTPPLTS